MPGNNYVTYNDYKFDKKVTDQAIGKLEKDFGKMIDETAKNCGDIIDMKRLLSNHDLQMEHNNQAQVDFHKSLDKLNETITKLGDTITRVDKETAINSEKFNWNGLWTKRGLTAVCFIIVTTIGLVLDYIKTMSQ